ncbi:MAG TPA: hypothetical protein VMF65_12415 [Acidimicrobiales bacterium]|nr:hypothetical protein [Acidimicrobiales bacterium]
MAQRPANRSAPGKVQRHASFEHRILGDVPPSALFALGAHKELEGAPGANQVTINGETVQRANVVHLLEQELHRLQAWQTVDPRPASMADFGQNAGNIRAQLRAEAKKGNPNDAKWNVRVVAIESTHPDGGGRPLLVTYGELNTLADFYGSVEELKAADPVKRRNVVQSVRLQSYQELSKILDSVRGAPPPQPVQQQNAPPQPTGVGGFMAGVFGSAKAMATGATKQATKLASDASEAISSSMFPGAFNITGTAGEVGQMTQDKKGGSDTTSYTATLARNACHFAPESWHSWEDHHHKALELAKESYAYGQNGDNRNQALKLNEAVLVNGFGDHYLQDSYAAGHLMNKAAIMQMYVRYIDKNPRWNAGYTTDATWRAFQNMAYNQEGLSSRGQYDKSKIGRRDVGGKQVTTATNAQAVENTQNLPGFTWQDRFEMLGLKVPDGASPGTPAWKVLVWMQQPHGGVLGNRYNVDFELSEVEAKATDIGVSRNEVADAVTKLLDGNVVYLVSEKRSQAGKRLDSGNAAITGKFTLRKEWVVSMSGSNESRFNTATANAATATPGSHGAYEAMAKATVYKDYVVFMRDAYLQKATNAAHDYFCEQGLKVSSGDKKPLFKIYGDYAMLNSESAAGVRESGITANMSRDSITETARTGVEPAWRSSKKILARLPSHVEPPGGGNTISLADWQSRDGALENWLGPNVFDKMNAAINAVMGAKGSLGKITKDENIHGTEAF